MRELTSRQREVLSFMRSFQSKHGVPPTVRELGERFRITPRAAFDHLRALERKGELQRRPSVGRTSRALTLPDLTGGRAHHSVPILGRIAAGSPLLAQENREGEVPIAAAALPARGEDVFALRTSRAFASVARSRGLCSRSAPSSPGAAFVCWSRADSRRHELPDLRLDEQVEQRAVHVAGPSLVAQDVERLVAGDAALVRAV